MFINNRNIGSIICYCRYGAKGNIRSLLFDLGCVKEEMVSPNGTMFANITIGNDELDKFINLKGFEVCDDKDILFENTNT